MPEVNWISSRSLGRTSADRAIEHVIRQAVAQREKCIEADRRLRHLAADDDDMVQQRQRATRERMVESGLGRAQERKKIDVQESDRR